MRAIIRACRRVCGMSWHVISIHVHACGGVVWRGVASCGIVARLVTSRDAVWCRMASHGMVLHGITWHGVTKVWHEEGMALCGAVWCAVA